MSYQGDDNRYRVRQSSRETTSPPAHMRHMEKVRSEDEMYELRRQEQLRLQIQAKERELEAMSIKNRANHQSFGEGDARANFTGSAYPHQAHIARSGSNQGSSRVQNKQSPLRSGSRDGSRDGGGHTAGFMSNYGRQQHMVPGGYNRDIQDETAKLVSITSGNSVRQASAAKRPPIPSVNNFMRQRSPGSPSLRKKSYGSKSPTRDVDMRDAGHGLITGANMPAPRLAQISSPVRSASNEYIAQLQTDNSSLETRLNMVLNELDRVNRDRSNLVQKVSVTDQDIKMMQDQLGSEDAADQMNHEMQFNLNGQREQNVTVKQHIAEVDMTRTEAIQKLRALQGDRDRRTNMAEELKDDLHKKLGLSKQLDHEQMTAHNRINELEEQLNLLNRQAMADNGQIEDTQRIRDKISLERDELHTKLEHLNHTYDNCVNEIGRERQQMDGHNRHHNKLLVAKVTFCLLEQMFKRRKQMAISEFFQYCKFDTKCHKTLKQFVQNLERLGQYRLKIAIKQWHQRCFKPMEAQIQEQELCEKFMRKKLLTKMFNMWRWKAQNSDEIFGAKNKALQAIWNAKVKDCGKDVQRAFSIWRDKLKYDKFRNQRCKKLVWKAYTNKLALSWQKWVNYSQTMNQQMRLHVLAREFAENQLKRISFAEMRFVLFDLRRKRLNRLRTYVKAWKESNQYRKFILAANMTVLGFKKECNSSMLKMCFDALRVSKEEEKLMLMSEALEGDCMPAIQSLNKDVELKTQTAVRSGKNRGVTAIKAMIYRQVAEYFNKWKGAQKRHNVMLNQNLKGMIISRWQQMMKDGFDLWKKGKGHKEITMAEMQITEMQEEGSNLAQASETLEKEIKIEKAKVDKSGRQSLTRGTRIMKKRYLKQYMDKWAEVNKSYKNQQSGSDVILSKIKKRMFRQAFDRYKAWMARTNLEERNEGSCDHLRNTLNCRLMRKCFNAIRTYNGVNVKAKTYAKIVFGKMDHWMKKRAFGTWMDGGNLMKMEILQEEQNVLTDEMTVKNNEIGNLSKKVADKSTRNAQRTQQLKKAGQRSMSNAFARAYFKRITRAFEVWKNWASCDDHKQRIIRRTLHHWKTWNAKFLMSVMKNWKDMANINDTKKKIAEIEYQMGDADLVTTHNTAEYKKQKEDLLQNISGVNGEFDNAMNKRSKLMALMSDQNQNCHFQGRLRYIFLQWSAHTKRQVHLANCIKNTILKSIWERGFQNIREYARDKQLTRDQNKSLAKIRNMFWKRNCGSAMSKWRQTEYEQTLEMTEMTETTTQEMQSDHMEKKKVIQKQNITRSAKIVGKLQKQKFLKAWKNVTRWLKHKRVSTANLLEAQSSYACKRLIGKWRQRTDMTVACRGAYTKFQEKRVLLYKKAVYRELMCKHHRDKALVIKLSNMANSFDNKGLQAAFQMISNYSTTKANVHAHEKSISSRNIGDCLTKIYRRKLLSHYTHMRLQILGNKVVDMKKRLFFAHFMSQSTRDAFERWKKKALYAQTVIEINEGGPVVEQVLEARMDVMNLKKLMADEGFTDYQVNDVYHNADKKGLELIARSLGRWKCWNGTDDYLKPKMFDRWRAYVKMRKIVKHWLDVITNRQEHKKADLSFSFNKWKHFFADKQNHLQRKTRAMLKNRAVQAAKRLEILAETTHQDEDLVNHISDQNEELFVNYRKGQRLALALGRDNLKFGMMQGFKVMMESAHADRKRQLEGILARNIDMIATTKDKIKEVETDNECLANENEELRQFSLDGYQLGRNVQNLTSEREQLSVDLADKADTIRRLLDENERLSVRLRQAQDNAAHLLRASQTRA